MTRWHIIQTVGMKERWVGNLLNKSLGLHWYVPVEEMKIVRRARVFEHVRPLMPTYVFVHGIEPGVHHDVKSLAAVHRILDECVSSREVEAIRRLEAEHNRALEDWRQAKTTYRVDDRVRVTKGAFQSMETLITAIRGSKAFVSVPMLGSTRDIELPLEVLEKVA